MSTPAETIQKEERSLKRAIYYSIESSDLQDLINDFIQKTGLLVNSIEINFIDCSTIDGTKKSVLYECRINREEA